MKRQELNFEKIAAAEDRDLNAHLNLGVFMTKI